MSMMMGIMLQTIVPVMMVMRMMIAKEPIEKAHK